jgi:hypothetical protein
MKFKMYTESIHLLFLDFLRFTVDFRLKGVFNNYTVHEMGSMIMT